VRPAPAQSRPLRAGPRDGDPADDLGRRRLAAHRDGSGDPELNPPSPGLAPHPFPPAPEWEDFDGPDLPIDFQWLRSPFPDDLFSLTARPGWLRLHGRETIGSQYRQALVARRQQAFCYSARTVLDFAPEHFQQAAGLVCYYGASKFHYLFVSRDDEHGRHLQVMSALPDSPQADAFTAPIPLPDDGPGPPARRGRLRAPALRLQPGRPGLDLAAPGVRRLDPVGRSHRPRRAQLHRRLRRHGLPGPVGPGALTVDHWFQLSGVEVEAAKTGGAIAILGDSITDGYGVKPNTNLRWPDALMARLQAHPKTRGVAVLNLGVGGGRVLLNGLGPNAAARFDRDVLMQAGVRWAIILEGVNDLGGLTRDAPVSDQEHAALVDRITTAYAQMAQKARARGVKVIGATIMPYGGSDYYHPDAANERDRQAINAWIRTPGNFDAVIDMDKTMRDPAKPDRLLPAYDSGDHLHPSMEGYRVMAKSVPLELFAR
jgi:lysophospholipase L1-like esterase